MKNFKLASRYARALNEEISDDAELEGAVASFDELGEMVAGHDGLRGALSNPGVTFEKRLAILEGILRATQCHDTVAGLVRVLLKRRRMEILPDAAMVFADLADERLNRISAEVTTAHTLSEEQSEKIRRALERFSGRSVRVEERVDGSLLGGVVAYIDGRVIDGSLRTRLERMKSALMAQET